MTTPSGCVVQIVRPSPAQWPEIIRVLETRNFHDIGGPEMPEFPIEDCFVALVDGVVRGVGGYRLLSDRAAKTTLLAVHPDFAHLAIGQKLQIARLTYLREKGIRSVTTNTDDPRVARWLEKKFGFVRTGKSVPKVSDFGNRDVDAWINLRVEFD